MNGDDRRVLPKTGVKYRTSESDVLTPVAGDTGRWVKWVIHFKHTYNADGFMDIWKDGIQVYSKNGIRTSFNDVRGPAVMMGSSKWSWKTDKYPTIKPARRQSYLDAVRIAQGADRYDDVAPVSIVDSNQPAVVEEKPVVTEKPVVEEKPVVTEKNTVVKQSNLPSFRKTKDLIEIGFEQSSLLSNGLKPSGNAPILVSRNAPVFEGKQSLSLFIDKNKSKNLIPFRICA